MARMVRATFTSASSDLCGAVVNPASFRWRSSARILRLHGPRGPCDHVSMPHPGAEYEVPPVLSAEDPKGSAVRKTGGTSPTRSATGSEPIMARSFARRIAERWVCGRP
jgi:hypothetical protein